MSPIPLFVELCAGTAALSLRLHKLKARPPVSRMGSKAGYAEPILRALGLAPGQGAERYLWAEADPGVRLLLAAYTDRALARGAAEVIRGWAGEEPRALWERLRAEGPCKGAAAVDPYDVARWLRIVTSNRLINVGPDWKNTGAGGSTFGGTEFCTAIEDLLRAVEGVEEVPGVVTDRASVDPGEVARFVLLGVWSYRQSQPESGFIGPGQRRQDTTATATATATERIALGMPGLVTDRADFEPPRLPAGTVVVIDPPYVGTTGYGHDLPRTEVVRVARAWREAGARVGVCEQEPIAELVGDGWCFVDIADLRVGQKRTFSKQQREVVTLSEAAPAGWATGGQVGLFGGGR